MSTENMSLIQELDNVLGQEITPRHSYFQLKYFVIGKEPTIQSKMWQCLRELKSRKESLESIDLEAEETKDKLELIDIAIEKANEDKLKIQGHVLLEKEIAIKIRQYERQKQAALNSLKQLATRKKGIEEESIFFIETFKNLQKIEPLKNFDDLEAQTQYWTERLSQKLNLRMLTHNNIDTELIETIVSLPDELPIKKQTLATLSLRHATMVKQLKDTMHHLENSDKKQD